MDQALNDFYTHLNEVVVTTNDFSEGAKFRKREKVDQFASCGLNPMYRSYLSFDIDIPGSAFRFEEVNLPPHDHHHQFRERTLPHAADHSPS